MSQRNAPAKVTNESRLRMGYALLVPALILFSVRAALEWGGWGDVPGWSLAIVGIMSGAGMLAAAWATYKTPEMARAWAAVAIALLGHYVVSGWIDSDLGGAMVYLGTGFLASLRVRWAQYAALTAGLGALLRGEVAIGFSHALWIAGALGIAAALLLELFRPAGLSGESA